MKRNALILVLMISLALSACGDGHKHDFSQEWLCDEAYHWHVCTVCGKKDEAPHNFGNDNECDECGYWTVSQGLGFEFDEQNGSYIVTGIGDCIDANVIIPSEHNDKPVTGIADGAFASCVGLVSMGIPDGITSIGSKAFAGCGSLRAIILPTGLTRLCDGVFRGCSKLSEITVPNGVTSIGNNAFEGCENLYDVTLGDVTSIGENAFRGCSRLWSITLPESVSSVGDGAFEDCSGLREITVTGGADIAENAFENCPIRTATVPLAALKTVASEILTELTLTSGDELRSGMLTGCLSLKSLTLPDSITIIGDEALSGLKNLEMAALGKNVTRIGDKAFYESGIQSPTLPVGVITIGESAFEGCGGLKNVRIPKSVTSIGDRAFSACPNLKSVTIEARETSIGEEAFYSDRSLESVTVLGGITSIGGYAFEKCGALKELRVDDLAAWCNTEFKNSFSNPMSTAYDFYIGGDLIESLEIPDTVTEIKAYAFYRCVGLKRITIPESVTSIGDDAFAQCPIEEATVPAFAVKSVSQACRMKNITISSGDRIEDFALSGCYNLQSVTMPAGIKSIGRMAFNGCRSLRHITMPRSVTSIGEAAFYDCAELMSLQVPAGMTSIGERAFFGCERLASVTFEKTDGWETSLSADFSSAENLDASELSDPSQAAQCLVSKYCDRRWRQKTIDESRI